jgi:hypothetical protein
MSVRTRQSSWRQLIFKDGAYLFERKIKTEEFDSVLFEWKTTKTETVYEPLSVDGLVKELEFSILIVRSAIAEPSLTPRKGFFHQRFKARIPSERKYANTYLKLFSEICNNGKGGKTKITRLMLERLPNESQTITVGGTLGNPYSDFLTPLHAPKRVSEENARKIFMERDCLKFFSEDNSGNPTFALV